MRVTTEEMNQTSRGFPYPDIDRLPPDVRAKYESLPAKINLFRMLAHSAGLFVPLMDFTKAIFKNLALSKHDYELVVLLTAQITGADYEWRQHLAPASKAGVREDQMKALEERRINDSRHFDQDEQLALRMAAELLEHTEISEPTLQQAKVRFGPEKTIELIIVVGFYRAIAGVIRSVALDFNPDAAAALASGM